MYFVADKFQETGLNLEILIKHKNLYYLQPQREQRSTRRNPTVRTLKPAGRDASTELKHLKTLTTKEALLREAAILRNKAAAPAAVGAEAEAVAGANEEAAGDTGKLVFYFVSVLTGE